LRLSRRQELVDSARGTTLGGMGENSAMVEPFAIQVPDDVQRTRPQTLAYVLSDSPVGLAGWIIEKWRNWSDCDGDVESRFTKDELLTNVMIYWVTNTVASLFRLYYDWALGAFPDLVASDQRNVPSGLDSHPMSPGQRIEIPAGVTLSPAIRRRVFRATGPNVPKATFDNGA
jgi:hypothetical protein